MSTKVSLKYHRDEQGGGWFHLYRDCFDFDNEFVYLELRGVPIEAANSFDLTGEKGFGSVAVRIPEDWARKLGLLGERPETQSGIESQTQ